MKLIKYIIILFVLINSNVSFSQEGISFQGLIMNNENSESTDHVYLINQEVCLKFSIVNPDASIEYQEENRVSTDQYGMVNVLIGNGSATSAGRVQRFNEINWGSLGKRIKVECDFEGACTNFSVLSDETFQSIPYAKYSEVSSTISTVLPLEKGGTGSTVKNFVDLNENQDIAGEKTFKDEASFDNGVNVSDIYFGIGAGNFKTNTVVGNSAFQSNTSGQYNTAFGLAALNKNNSFFNTALGHYTLVANESGYANTAVGAQALFKNTTGRYNLGVGVEALASNTTGLNNTGVGGYDTLLNNTEGSNNTALGYAAMYTNKKGSQNVALGINSLYENTIGVNNTVVGSSSGYHSTGDNNIFVGFATAYNMSTGNSNIYIGNNAGNSSSGDNNILIGNNVTNKDDNGSNQINIGNIIKGNLVTGDIEITGNIKAKGFSAEEQKVFSQVLENEYLIDNTEYNEVATVEITNPGNYVLNFGSFYKNEDASTTVVIALFINDGMIENSLREDTLLNLNEKRSLQLVSLAQNLQAGQKIKVKCKVAEGKAKINKGSLIVQKI
jgi:hypothetical protein